MTTIINSIIKFVILALFLLGVGILFKSRVEEKQQASEQLPTKSLVLKKYLLKYQKPERIEILGLSEKYRTDIEEIKKLKVAQDKASDFYVTIKLFTDETDTSAPLVAQIQFIDLKSGNLRKEESINLE